MRGYTSREGVTPHCGCPPFHLRRDYLVPGHHWHIASTYRLVASTSPLTLAHTSRRLSSVVHFCRPDSHLPSRSGRRKGERVPASIINRSLSPPGGVVLSRLPACHWRFSTVLGTVWYPNLMQVYNILANYRHEKVTSPSPPHTCKMCPRCSPSKK